MLAGRSVLCAGRAGRLRLVRGVLGGSVGVSGGASVSVGGAGGSVLASQDPFGPLTGGSTGTLAQRSRAGRAYGRLPLAFEPNRGRFDRRALFVARGSGYSIFLTRRSAVLGLSQAPKASGPGDGARGRARPAKASKAAAVAIGFVGGSGRARLSGGSGLPGKVNYLIGRDRSKWQRNVPTFARVVAWTRLRC